MKGTASEASRKRWWQPTPATDRFAGIVAAVMALLFLISAVAFALPILFAESGTSESSSQGWMPVVVCLVASAYGVLYAKAGPAGLTHFLDRVVWPTKRQ